MHGARSCAASPGLTSPLSPRRGGDALPGDAALEMVQNAVQNAAGDCIYHGTEKPAQDPRLCARSRRGDPSLCSSSTKESPGAWLLLVWPMEPILIQDAEDIIDLNKLSVKEKL